MQKTKKKTGMAAVAAMVTHPTANQGQCSSTPESKVEASATQQ